MKLKTSFFNGTVLRKNLTRFAPVWGLFTAFLLLVWFIGNGAYIASNEHHMAFSNAANHSVGMMKIFGWANFFYGGLCVLLLFGDLFKSRLCNALHAMPLRREGWLLTHTASGLLFCLIPYGVLGVTQMFYMGKFWYFALLQLAVAVMEFVCYFGIGVLCVMFTGNAFAMGVAYTGFIFLAPICYWLVTGIFEPALENVLLPEREILQLAPAIRFSNDPVDFIYGWNWGGKYQGLIVSQWIYMGIACAVGVVAWVLSLLLYRRRKLESAGDFLALRWLHPIFQIFYTLCVGAFVFLLFGNNRNYVFLAIGLLIGFFTGKMLLNRTVRVFSIKAVLQFLALGAVLAATIVLLTLDPLHLIHRVPKPEQVEKVTLNFNTAYDPVLDDREDVKEILELHKSLVETRRDASYGMRLKLTYTMKDGSTYRRTYRVPYNSGEMKTLRRFYSDWKVVFGIEYTDTLYLRSSVTVDASNDMQEVPKEHLQQLLAAIYADCEAGSIVPDTFFFMDDSLQHGYHLMLSLNDKKRDIQISSACVYTVKVLNEMGFQPYYKS